MISSRFSYVLIFVLSFSYLFPQSKKHWIEEGDKYFKQHEYSTAIANYLKAMDDTAEVKKHKVLPYEVQFVNQKFKKDSAKARVILDTGHVQQHKGFLGFKRHTDLRHTSPYDYALIQLAHSYLLNSDDIDALNRYKEAVDRGVPDARYFYAITLMELHRYQDAMTEFEKYANSEAKNDSLKVLAQKKQAGCFLGLDSMKVNKEVLVRIMDTSVFNKGNSAFAVSYFPTYDKVLFTSARPGNTVLDPKKEEASYLCDLFTSDKSGEGWSPEVNIKAPINTNFHEGAACVTEDAIYFTKWHDGDPKDVSIWRAKKREDRFFTPEKLGSNINVPGFRSMHPSISSDGKKFFFSSDRPGGKGGLDIWMVDIGEGGMLGEPKNVGQPINTNGNEVTPFLHVLSGMLYFSSNGLPGLGGLDIFKSEYNAEDGTFGMPINLNSPINSSKDDAYYVQEKTVEKGFFSSDRAECPGGNCYKVYEYLNKPVVFDIKGAVFDGTTNEPLPGALVSIINVHKGDESVFVVSDEKGEYFAELKGNSEYFMKAQKNKYLADAGSETTKDKAVTTHFEKDFFLNKIPEGEIEIAGIEYDFNSAALRPASMANLDKIVDLLNLNNNLSIDIEANTDSRGNDDYNMKLSQARAQSCVDYLVSKGIESSRLRAKGFGETNPLVKDEEIKKLKSKSPEWEAAHQKNRRTALRVVGESEIKIINKGQ